MNLFFQWCCGSTITQKAPSLMICHDNNMRLWPVNVNELLGKVHFSLGGTGKDLETWMFINMGEMLQSI